MAIRHFGSADGEGEFYIIIDFNLCDNCGDCISACPSGVLIIGKNELDPEDEKEVVIVKEKHINELKFTCTKCKDPKPCITACEEKSKGAIKVSLSFKNNSQ